VTAPTHFRPLMWFCLALLLVWTFGCQSKNVVKKLTNRNPVTNTLDRPQHPRTQTDRLDGVVYRLPRTVVEVAISVKKATKAPGVFKDFAPCFFSKDEVQDSIQEISTQFSIEEPIFSSRGEPDPAETYVVKTKGSYFEAKTVFMEYTPTGLLSKGEAESTDNSLDFTLKAINTATTLGVNLAAASRGVGALRDAGDPDAKRFNIPNIDCAKEGFARSQKIVEQKLTELRNTDGRFVALVADAAENCLLVSKGLPIGAGNACPFGAAPTDKTIIERYIALLSAEKAISEKIAYVILYADTETKKAKKAQRVALSGQLPTLPPAEQPPVAAKIAALDLQLAALGNPELVDRPSIGQEVEEDFSRAVALFLKLEILQKRRDDLISQASDVPPETFKEMLAKTNSTITEYREAFLGGSAEKIWTAVVDFTPTVTANPVALKYSASHGVCTLGTLAQDQNIIVNPKFLNGSSVPCDKDLNISITPNPDDVNFTQSVGLAHKDNQISGWFYRIPARGRIKLVETAGAANSMLGSEELAIAQYGTIVSMPAKTAGKTSTSSVVLDEATGALKNFKVSSTPLLDENTLKEAQSAAQTLIDAGDPLTKKKRELELLQLQNKINEERKTLNNANSSPEPSPTP